MPALQKRPIAIRLGGGIETKLDGKVVPTTKLLALENGTFTRGVTVAKRHGYEAMPTAVLGSPLPYDADSTRGLAVRELPDRQGELLLLTDDRCYSLVEGANAWSDAGVVLSVAQRHRALVGAPSAQTAGDYASAGGIGLVAWQDSATELTFALVEDDGGRVVQGPISLGFGRGPRCVRVGDRLALLYATLGKQLLCVVFDPAQPQGYDAARFPIVVADDLALPIGFDAAFVDRRSVDPGADRDGCAICWSSPDGVRVGWLDPSGVVGSPVTGWGSPVTIAGTAGTVFWGPTVGVAPWAPDQWGVAWGTAAGASATWVQGLESEVKQQSWSPVALSAASAPASGVTCAWRMGAAAAGDDALDVWWEERVVPIGRSVVRRQAVSSLGVEQSLDPAGRGGVTRGASLASKAWSDPPAPSTPARSASHVALVHDVPLFSVYLAQRHDGVTVARTLAGAAGYAPGGAPGGGAVDSGSITVGGVGGGLGGVASTMLPSVTAGGRAYRWTAIERRLLVSEHDDQFTPEGLRLVDYDFADPAAHQSAQLGASLYLGGACQSLYDGAGWVEASFHYAVDWEVGEVLHVASSGGGGGMAPGVRDYVFWPEFTTADGEVIRGPTSKPYTVTTTGGEDKVSFTIPVVGVTRMSSAVGRVDCQIAVARTKDGDTSVYYRCTSLDPSAAGDNGYVVNDVSAATVSFVDVLSDADLADREPLYANGQIPSNDPVDASIAIAAGKNRLFHTDPAEQGLVHHSQERDDGYAAEVAPELVVGVDSFGGEVTAVAVMDDAVILFKRAQVYFVAGPGPLADPGAGGGWSAPSLITSDVGCVDQRSVAVTPAGLIFQSAKGIYLLDRSHQVTYVGAPVEAYNGQRVARATLVEDTTQVRLVTDQGATLLYDYFFDQWSTFTQHAGKDAAVSAGRYHYLAADGRVMREVVDPAAAHAATDAGRAYPLVMETAWIHLADYLQGVQRIYHLVAIGNWRSPHLLRMQYRVDYQGDWSSPAELDATAAGGGAYGEGPYGEGPYGGATRPAYQWRWYLGVRCQAIQFRFSDYTYAGQAGPAYELTELLVEAGFVYPVAKIAAARSH